MSRIVQSLKKKISKIEILSDVVKMMKNLSSAKIIPAQKAVESMDDYDQEVRLGFEACIRYSDEVYARLANASFQPANTGVIIFGSDRGMVGQFNEIISEYACNEIKKYPGEKVIWAIGEKVNENLIAAYPDLISSISLPHSVEGITDFVDRLVTGFEKEREKRPIENLYVVYNKLVSESGYEPISEQVLPLNFEWLNHRNKKSWSTRRVPDVIGGVFNTFVHLLQEYIFVTFYKICAESMASENASRLAMMEEAEQNIHKLLDSLKKSYFQERQKIIDEELFDIIAGFEAKEK